MFIEFILPVLFAVTLSCKKNDVSESAAELLTQKQWTPVSYGYDRNANGLIDASEENIRDCEKDNKYSFVIDGNGLFEDNSLSCGNGIAEMPFTWRLVNDETTLDFLFTIAKISRLDSEQLIIYNDTGDTGGQSTRYIQIFKH